MRAVVIVIVALCVLFVFIGNMSRCSSGSAISDTSSKAVSASTSTSASSPASAKTAATDSTSSRAASSAKSSASASTKVAFVDTLASIGTFDEQTIEGSGDDVVEVPVSGKPCIIRISNSGSSNFVVKLQDSSGEDLDLMVNEIGDYQGTVTDYEDYKKAAQLEIQSSDDWSITFAPLANMEHATNGSSFTGDNVCYIDEEKMSKLAFENSGESNFVVKAYGMTKSDLLVNKIGDYSGSVAWNQAQSFLVVSSSGDWTVSW